MVFIGCIAIKQGYSAPIVSLAFGFAVFLVILTSRRFSGAHINPAVSIAFAANGNLEREALPGYIIAQCLGGWFAALIVLAGQTTPSVSTSQAWGIEIAITLLLMYSIHVLVRRKVNLFLLALGVGSMVGVLAFLCGGFTGASMNPARTLGPNIVNGEGNLILYIVAPVIGAVLANFIPEPLDEAL